MDKRLQNLADIISSFGYRPNLIAKYMIENNLLNTIFLQTLDEGDFSSFKKKPNHFRSFQDVRNHFSDILKTIDLKLEIGELTEKLNKKLDQLIKEEKFEDAISIRDYMIKNKIPRNYNDIKK